MFLFAKDELTRRNQRIRLWFLSVLLAIVLFVLAYALPASFSRNMADVMDVVEMVFLTTSIYAIPVALLYLPLVIALKDATKWRLWALLIVGVLIGPAAIALWSLIWSLAMKGLPEDEISMTALAPSFTLFAFIVGAIATVAYIFLLRVHGRRAYEEILTTK